MNARRSLAVVGLGFAGAQAGHLLAYELRYGGAAMVLQSSGAHAYFPVVARTGLGVVAALAIMATFIVAAARAVSGRRIATGSAPSFWRLLPVVYTVQLACFAAQETFEALAGGAHPSSAPLLLLWGAAGQLPVAVVASLTLRWLLARLEPALAELRAGLAPAYRRIAVATALTTVPPATGLVVAYDVMASDPFRGPPSF